MSEISEYVQRNDKDWRHRIEFLFLLIRLGQSNRICDLYGGGTPIPVRKLGINRRVALSKWLSDKPMAQVALNRVPADLYLGLLPFQKLKMRILTCEAEAFARRSWGHQEVERQFSEYTSSSLRDELDARFVPAYDIIRSQMRFMEVRWCARQRAEFSDLVSSCLQTKTPFSMVRLSDREAYMFADGSRYFTLADVESCERHWWRVQLARDQRERLACLMRSASDNADVLGVPSIYRLLRETDVKSKSFLSSLQGRGLTEVAHHVSLRSQPGQLFTEEKANVHLFDDLGSIAAISRSAGRIVLIASASEPEIRSVFEPFGQLCYIPIPTHSRTMGNDKYAAERTSLPLVYEQIREQIALTVQPGDLVLVAGGVIGKIFLHDAKRAGGVALDIGTCLDSWVGARIQSLT